MSSSTTRLEFRVTALRAQIDRRHAEKVAELEAAHKIRKDHHGAVVAWRAEQERRVRSLASQLRKGNVTDSDLSGWSLDYEPHDHSGRADAELTAGVQKAYEQRDGALRRLEAVRAYVPEGETEPVLALTPGMVRDWFGL